MFAHSAVTEAPPATIDTPAFLWTVPERVVPPDVTLHTVPTLVLAVPEFVRLTVHVAFAPREHVTMDAVTLAELVNDPKRPNTNPAIAIAAIRVIAISMTVARTGLIAFLRCVGAIRNVNTDS